MKKIILISLGIIILAAAGLGTYVSMIDWNKHKDRLAKQISEVIGKKVEFSGNLQLSYFPHPVISAQAVNVINPQTGETLAKISQLKTDISLFSLLKGAPDIQTLHLVGAEFWVTLDENNRLNWLNSQKSEFIENNDLLMKTMNIENSELHLKEVKHDINIDLTSFTAELKADSVNGPYRLDGNFVKDGERYGTAFSIDGMSQLDDMNLMFVILHQGSYSYVRYDGTYNMNSNLFKGFIKGDFQRTSEFVNSISRKTLLSDIYNVPLQFSVDITSDSSKIDMEHFSISFANFLIGSGELSLPKQTQEGEKPLLTVKYQLKDIDFRPLFTLINERLEQYRQGQKFVLNLPYDVDYDLSAVRVVVSDKPDGIMENVSMKGRLQNDSFSIDDFYAGCAGNTIINITANLTSDDGVPQCSANVVVDGKNVRSMINSFGFNLSAPVQGAYQNGKIAASIKFTPENILIEQATATLDKSKFKLSAGISLPSLITYIQISADKINLDNYIFPLSQETPQNFEAIIKRNLSDFAKLSNKPLRVQASADEAIFRGVTMKDVQVDMQYTDNNLTLHKFVANEALNTSLDISGVIRDVLSPEPKIENMLIDIKSQNLIPISQKMYIPLPEWPLFSQKNITLKAALNGDFNKVTVKSDAAAGDSSMNYNGTFGKNEDNLELDGDIVLKTTRLEQLLSDINLSGASQVYRGVLNGKAHITGNANEWNLKQAELKLGSAQYTGDVFVGKNNNIYQIKGDVVANELNWAQFIKTRQEKNQIQPASHLSDTFISRLNLSRETFDFSPYRNLNLDINLTAQKSVYQGFSVNNLKLHLIGAKGRINFQDISVSGKNADVTGNIIVDYVQTPKISGNLTWNKLNVDNIGGSIYAISSDDIKANIDFISSAQSMESIIASLSGTLNIKTSDLKIKGINLAALEKDLQDRKYSKGLFGVVQENLQSGETEFEPIEKTINLKDGVAVLEDISLKNEYSDVAMNGKINLKDWRMNVGFEVSYPRLKEVPAFSFEFGGALNKPIIDISVDDIAHKYDAYWEKIAREEQAERDKMLRAIQNSAASLSNKMDADIKRAEDLIKVIDGYVGKKLVKETLYKYDVKKKSLEKAVENIDSMKMALKEQNVSNDDILRTERQLQVIRQEIDIIGEEIDSFASADINSKMEKIFTKVTDAYQNCQREMNNFNAYWQRIGNIYEEIEAGQYFVNNKEANNLYNEAKQLSEECISIYDKFNDDYENMKKMPTGMAKINKKKDFNQTASVLNDLHNKISNVYVRAHKILISLLHEKKTEYDRIKQEEEKKRRMEEAEDAGNLLADMKPKKDEDIIDAANDADNNKADAEEKTMRSGGKIIPSYGSAASYGDTKQQPSFGILRPIEGDAQKTSGTIKIK